MRTVPFGDVLDFVAVKLYGRKDIQREEAAALTTFINDAVRVAWEREFWPELMRIEERYYREEWDVATTYYETAEVYLLDSDGDPIYYRALRTTIGDSPDVSTDDWEVADDLLRYVPLDGDEVSPVVAPPSTPTGDGGTGINADVASWDDLGALTTVGSSPDASVDDYVMWVNKDPTYPLGLQVTQLTLSTAATNIPFVRRPDDYVSQSPHLVWVNFA